MVLHTAFAADADMTIVTVNGARFGVSSTELTRFWPSFIDVAPVAAPRLDRSGRLVFEVGAHSIMLEPLLQLAHGLPVPGLYERPPRALGALAHCARRYKLHGPEQTLLFVLRSKLAVPHISSTRDYLEILRASCELGLPDVAQEAERRLLFANLEGQDFETIYRVPRDAFARLLGARAERVKTFTVGLTDESPDGVFVDEYRAVCRSCRRTQRPDVTALWRQFVAVIIREFERQPSVDGAAASEHVQDDIQNLARYGCSDCGRTMFPWTRLRRELLSLVDSPVSPSPSRMWL